MKLPGLKVEVTKQGDAVTVTMVGEAHFDFDASDAHIKTVVNLNPKSVVVDAGKLTFITSIGICFLINLRRHIREMGGSMKLTNLQPQVRKVMELTHVIHLFELG